MAHDLRPRRQPAALARSTRRTTRRTSSASPASTTCPLTVPRRLGEILREPGLLGAAAGGLLVLAFMRRKAALPIAAGFVSHRRVLRARGGRACRSSAATCCSPPRCSRSSPARACSAGATLPADHAWRTRWAVDRRASSSSPSRLHPRAGRPDQRPAQRDAHAERHPRRPARASATRSPASRSRCPNHRPVPHIALWTGIAAGATSCPPSSSSRRRGSYIDPASERVRAQLHARPERPEAPHGDRAAAASRRQRATRAGCSRDAAASASAASLDSPLASASAAGKWTVHPLSKSASRDCPPH